MFASRVILNPRHLLSRKGLAVRNAGETVREAHVVSIPPRVKGSFGVRVVQTVILTFSMYSIPAYILYRLPDYQKENRNAYTGK